MKKRITAIIVSGFMIATLVLGLASCEINDNSENSGGNIQSHEIYAVSLVSSIGYLSDAGSGGSAASFASRLVTASSARPDIITDDDVKRIEEFLVMFGGIVEDGGIEEEVRENTSSDPVFGEYSFEMTISLINSEAKKDVYTLYFNETGKNTKTEIDDGINETEESTTFEGVAVFGEELFLVRGVKEVEIEDGEQETSIEFRTYKNIGVDTPKADEKNYVQIEKSSELGEYEYEYTFVENGKKVKEIEIEYEERVSGVEISFESESGFSENSFEIKKSEKGDITIEFEKKGHKGIITVTHENDGSYTLTYANGFVENVNKK